MHFLTDDDIKQVKKRDWLWLIPFILLILVPYSAIYHAYEFIKSKIKG